MEEGNSQIIAPRPFLANSQKFPRLYQNLNSIAVPPINASEQASLDAYNKCLLMNTKDILCSKPNHKVLLIGKTGCGKTTTINMIMNLLCQNNYESQRKIAITQKIQFTNSKKETILSCNIPEYQHLQSDKINVSVINSQTSKCMIYPVTTQDFDISFIDTPGLGDTEGTQVDEQNIKNMIAQIQQLSEITCVLYIHKQSDLRKDLYLQYYVNALKQMLPKKYEDNFVVCFTNVFNPLKIDAFMTLKELGIPLKNFIYLENDCLTPIDIIPDEDIDAKEAAIAQSKHCWEMNRKQFDKLLGTITPMTAQKTSLMLDLYCKKQAIVKIIFQKQHQIEEIQLQKENIKATRSNILNAKFDLEQIGPSENVEMVKTTKIELKKELKVTEIELPEKATFCFNCCNLCHNPCYLPEVYDKGSINIRGCTAFCGCLEKCQVKKCSHHFSEHGHTLKITEKKEVEVPYESIVYEKKIVQNTDNLDTRKKLDDEIASLSWKENDIENQIRRQEEQIENDMLMIAYLIQQINESSMEFNSEIVVDYIKEQIQMTKDNSKLEIQYKSHKLQCFQQQLEQYQILKDAIEQCSQQQTVYSKITPQLDRQIKDIIEKEIEEVMQCLEVK